MQKTIIALLLSTIALKTLSQSKTAYSQPPESKLIQVSINKNVEFLGFVYYLGFEGADIERNNKPSEKKRYKYGYDLYQKYKNYTKSVHLAKSMELAQNIWLDYFIGLLIQLDDFPNAKLKPNVEDKYFLRFSEKRDKEEALQNVRIFLEELNAFYREVDFDTYLQNSTIYYENALSQVAANRPPAEFVPTMESFYGKSLDSYRLIPSLTLPAGMGFGTWHTSKGKTHIFNVFGALVSQELEDMANLNTGFDDKRRVREISTHEFGHSFVNPVIDQVPATMIEATKSLFEPIKTDMTRQNYLTWKVCLYEHFVRAGEIIIAKKMKNDVDAQNLLRDFEHNRKFIYLPLVIEELEKNSTKSYPEAVNKTMRKLKIISRKTHIQRSIAEKDDGKIYSVTIKAKKFGKSIEHKQNFASMGLTDTQKQSIKNHLLDSLGLPKLPERSTSLSVSTPKVTFTCEECEGKSAFEIYGNNFLSTRKSDAKKSQPLFPMVINLSPGEYRFVFKQRKKPKIEANFIVKADETNVIKIK